MKRVEWDYIFDIVLSIFEYRKVGSFGNIEEVEHIDKYQYIIDISINLNMMLPTTADITYR